MAALAAPRLRPATAVVAAAARAAQQVMVLLAATAMPAAAVVAALTEVRQELTPPAILALPGAMDRAVVVRVDLNAVLARLSAEAVVVLNPLPATLAMAVPVRQSNYMTARTALVAVVVAPAHRIAAMLLPIAPPQHSTAVVLAAQAAATPEHLARRTQAQMV